MEIRKLILHLKETLNHFQRYNFIIKRHSSNEKNFFGWADKGEINIFELSVENAGIPQQKKNESKP